MTCPGARGSEPGGRCVLGLRVLRGLGGGGFKAWVVESPERSWPPPVSPGFLDSAEHLALASVSRPRRVQLAFI